MSQQIRLFIAHSSEDQPFAEALVDLIRAALRLSADDIRCTSVDGCRLPAGADSDNQLRSELLEAEAFIGVISPHSTQSMYVLFELGARWGTRRHLIPLLAPGASADELKGPLRTPNALRADERPQLQQLVRNLATQLKIAPDPADSYDRLIDRILALPSAQVPPPSADHPETTTESPESLRPEEETILTALVPGRLNTNQVAVVLGCNDERARLFLRNLYDQRMIGWDRARDFYFLQQAGRRYLECKGLWPSS